MFFVLFMLFIQPVPFLSDITKVSNLVDWKLVEYKIMESYLSILLRTREISVQGFIRMSQKSTT